MQKKNQFIAKRKNLFSLIFHNGEFFEFDDSDNERDKKFWFIIFQILLMVDIFLFLIFQTPNRQKPLADLIFIAAAIGCGGVFEFIVFCLNSSDYRNFWFKWRKNE